jgi:hypothetical protein
MAKQNTGNCISSGTLLALAELSKKMKEDEMLEIGCVHLMLLTEEDECIVPPGEFFHPKMVVIIGYDKTKTEFYGNVFINTDINKRYATKEAKADHIPITSEQYTFLNGAHDPSHINCAAIKSYSRSRILSENKYKGKLSDGDIEKIISKVENTKQITPKVKNRFGFEDKSR